jgi:flagellar basal body-associated protein FliL
MNIGKRVRRRSILHPICTVSRTTLYNMVLILLSVIVAAIVVAISMFHTSSGILAGSGIAREDIAIGKQRSEQPTNTTQTKQFLVVVLPDGKVVNPMVADHF